MKRKHISLILFSIALIIIAVVHILDYQQTKFLVQSFKSVEESQQTLIKVNKLASYLKDIQRAHRGYVITHQREFLNAYETAVDVVPILLTDIRDDLHLQESQKSLVDSLAVKAQQKIDYVEAAIIQVSTGKYEEAIKGITKGKILFDQMTTLIGKIEADERVYTLKQQQEVKDNTDRNYAIVIVGFVSSVLLLLIAMIIVFINQNKIEKLNLEIESANKELAAYNEELIATNDQLENAKTQLLEIHKALEYREKQLLQAQQISKTGSIDWKLKTDAITYTSEFARIMGIRATQVYSFRSLMAQVHPDDREGVLQKIENAVRSGSRYQLEFRLLLKNTNTIYVLAVSEPYHENDEVIGYQGTITDITEQKKAHEELRLSEEKFRSVLEAAPDAMIIASKDGRIKILNRQTEKLFQYQKEELLEKNLEMLIPYKLRNGYFEQRATVVYNPKINESGVALRLSALRKDGTEVPIDIRISPFQANETSFLTVVIRDVSEQRKTEQKILEANARLESANEALKKANNELSSFSYSISHDLRAPLRAINGFSAILLEEYNEKLDAGGKKALNTIQQNSTRMDDLIKDLLELARLGNLALNKQRFRMQSLVENVLQDKILKSGTQLKVLNLGETYGDPGLLRQVWENLVSNAIKFSSKTESPTIEIGYSRKSNEHLYWVKDNGVGFDPAYTDKLFKVFSRLHAKKEFEGTGAGLAIVKKIVDTHGGRVWAEAQLLQGATFYFTLPVS